ncbi:ABC transporter substrate-binding protein [Salipaludibacillus sp. HK11]|uniref:ABC transporter substrate-binding protein n=1 Tax=Salipaludibacillus sp. HK11 TaxID=3394320 RepID=UPI0039FCA25D
MKFALILMLVMLAGCGNNDGDVAQGENVELEKVEIMLDWYPNAVHSYLYVADEMGYFEEEGLDVEIVFPTNPTDPINLAATGEVTLGITYQPDVITARNEDIPVVSVAAIVRSPLNHIVYLDEEIQSPKDLEGKTVGYPGIPVNEPLLETMVTADGGDFGQVEMIDVGFELGSSIVTGNVDAVIGAYINHEVPVLEHQGHDVHFFNPIDYGVPSFYELVMVTNEDQLEENQPTIQSFWNAAEKGYEYMKDNPDDSMDILFSHEDQENFPLIREVEEESLDILLTKMETEDEAFGSQYEASWQETIDWLYDSGYIEEKPEQEDIFINLVD